MLSNADRPIHYQQNNLEEGSDLGILEQTLDYTFNDPMLLRQALTHPSCDGELNYQRLEFLGDAVIELTVSKMLYDAYPDASEGELTRKRAAIVCTTGLAELAHTLRLGDYLIIGNGEAQSQGRRKLTILEDATEAIFGAIFTDGGYKTAQRIVERFFEERVRKVADGGLNQDYKSEFQIMVQARGKEQIKYVTVDREGPAHQPIFYVELTLNDEPIAGGRGSSKKQAEQKAAQYAVEHFSELYRDADTIRMEEEERAKAEEEEQRNLNAQIEAEHKEAAALDPILDVELPLEQVYAGENVEPAEDGTYEAAETAQMQSPEAESAASDDELDDEDAVFLRLLDDDDTL